MPGGQVKIRLRSGAKEIEIEGARADVDDLLNRWWQGSSDTTPGDDDDHDDEDGSTDRPSAKRPRAKTRRNQKRSTEPTNSDSSFDANSIVNEIKERDQFDAIERKIVRVAGERYNKIALTLWIVDAPLTSGQIHRILESLDIRISLSAVSTTLKTNMSKFITSAQRRKGGPPATYRLTATAKAEFEKWLGTDG